MVCNVQVNGEWKEVGKDITWEQYEEYCKLQDEKYQQKFASKLGVDIFQFKVLDLERSADFDTLLLRFSSSESLDDFVDEFYVSHFDTEVKVLDRTCGLVKARVY